MEHLNIILFNNFTALDAFGPAEVFAQLPDRYTLGYFSAQGGLIANSIGASVQTKPIADIAQPDILLIPGGWGTRALVNDAPFIAALKTQAERATWVLSVCTGSALLAKTGLLDGKQATGNKKSWDWVITQGPAVNWVRHARWTIDGNYYTSSGVSAGIDMALGFVADTVNPAAAQTISQTLEYNWQANKTNDPFA